jgi:hypothetical protein
MSEHDETYPWYLNMPLPSIFLPKSKNKKNSETNKIDSNKIDSNKKENKTSSEKINK